MSLNLTFKELLDTVGFSGTANIGGEGLDKAKSILTIPDVRKEISEQLRNYWAKNELSDLFVNVNDPPLVTDLRNIIRTFIEAERTNTPNFGTDPQLRAGRTSADESAKKSDPVVNLLISISDRVSSPSKGTKPDSTGGAPIPGAKVTPAGASFHFNASQLIITIRDEVLSTLNEIQLAALGSAGARLQENLTVPKSGVILVDSNIRNQFVNQPYPTYTGIDMQLIFMTPTIISNNITVKAISFSEHSGKIPVGTLGRDVPKGFAKGSRTIAGTIIATITVNDPLFDLQPVLYTSKNRYAQSSNDVWRTYLLPDQFPLFDILAFFNNEYGFASSMVIFGVSITDMGQVISMSDSEIEVTYTYVALDMDVLRNISYEIANGDGTIRTYDILSDNEYLAKRERAIRGISEHREISEIPSVFAAVDRRANEIAFQRLQNRGGSLSDMIKIKQVLDGTGQASSGKASRFQNKDM